MDFSVGDRTASVARNPDFTVAGQRRNLTGFATKEPPDRSRTVKTVAEPFSAIVGAIGQTGGATAFRLLRRHRSVKV